MNNNRSSDQPLQGEIVDGPPSQPNMTSNSKPADSIFGVGQVEPLAIRALLFAALSWTPIMPLLGGIVAIVIGQRALRRIRQSNGRLRGKSIAIAAQVISVLNIFAIWLMYKLVMWIF